MNIKVKITKQQNADFYSLPLNSVMEMTLREYLRGVVPSEIGSKYVEACRAQAVASRTFAWSYALSGKAISDDSSSAQCFNALRAWDDAYAVAHQAVDDTDGMILCYNGKPLSPCSFSASNGGRTTSSEKRWGGARPYLIEQDDPWDLAATSGKKTGHGVGLSQKGAQYAAKTGVSYQDILSFYYPGAAILKEESPMAKVKASQLVKIFNQMADEHWKYIAGAHKKGEVDCSGAFYYAYNKLGSYMYHGSNTMWRKYTTEKGKIGEIDLVPGMAVFKLRDWTSAHASNGWYETEPGDLYHVGCYVGNGKVVEAKGTKSGVVISDIDTWKMAAKLKDTEYDIIDVYDTEEEQFDPFIGVVKIVSGYLNIRSGPGTNYSKVLKANNGDIFNVVGRIGSWYKVEHQGNILYANEKYISKSTQPTKMYRFTIDVSEKDLSTVKEALNGFVYALEEVTAA